MRNKPHEQAIFILRDRRKKMAGTLRRIRTTNRLPLGVQSACSRKGLSFEDGVRMYEANIEELDHTLALLEEAQQKEVKGDRERT